MSLVHEVYEEPGFFNSLTATCMLISICVMYLLFADYFMDYCSLLDDEICCLRNCGVRFILFDD